MPCGGKFGGGNGIPFGGGNSIPPGGGPPCAFGGGKGGKGMPRPKASMMRVSSVASESRFERPTWEARWWWAVHRERRHHATCSSISLCLSLTRF